MAADPFTTNALTTAHNCGKVQMFREVLQLLRAANPPGFSTLMKELHDDRPARAADTAGDDN